MVIPLSTATTTFAKALARLWPIAIVQLGRKVGPTVYTEGPYIPANIPIAKTEIAFVTSGM